MSDTGLSTYKIETIQAIANQTIERLQQEHSESLNDLHIELSRLRERCNGENQLNKIFK